MRNALIILIMVVLVPLTGLADDWPQWRGPARDGVWRESGILEKFPQNGLQIRWRDPVGAGYSSPTVAEGRVFVIGRQVSEPPPKTSNAFLRVHIPGDEQILCFNEADGRKIWEQKYPSNYTMSYNAGPRAAPAVDGNRLYTLGGEGDLQCRDVSDGKLIWQKHLDHTPMWGFAASPLIDGDHLIVIGADPDGIALALDKNTGGQIWKALPAKEPGYSSPIIIEAGGSRQLIVWHPAALNSLDPQTGKLLWSEPFTVTSGMSIATPVFAGNLLFVTCFYNGSMMMRLDPSQPTAKLLWKIGGKNERKTEALHAVMCTPIIREGHIYGVCSYGQLRCLDALSGKRIWETFDATTGDQGTIRWANAFITPNGDRYFLFNESGDLIMGRLSVKGFEQISKAHLIDPTNVDPGRAVVWCQPAYADRSIFVRNDREIVCASLSR